MTRRLWKLVPYLWPARVWYLQLLAAICIVLLLLGRVVNVLMPITLAQLIDALTYGTSPWLPLARFVGLRFIQSGVLDNVRSALWLPVMQYSDREMSFLSFDHLMNLSLSFHNKRKLGEVTRILNRGSSVNTLFEVLLYMVIPTILDLGIAVIYILFFFGADIAAILACVMCMYAILSVLMTRWRTRMRRRMNEQDTVTRGIHTDCLMNYETVKYFTGEEHEGNRYRESVVKYQSLEYKVYRKSPLAATLTSFLQTVIITLGMTLGSLIIVRRITLGQATQALFVVFITYLSQLTGPLMSLGAIYRHLNQMLVDAEKLLQLLAESVDVQDKPGAAPLIVDDGVIEFENVSFSYDDRRGMSAVKDISFTIPKGKHVALVGESGSGKSTIMRLLFRFYDLKEGEGRILIDGKDIRDVTQKSLRRNIGVVPQDSVLFNETIGFNIGYGKFDASEEEIETAARAAQMHERIMSFPDQYQTKVGERGVKLSGGEKQRVAIARTLLKDPPILLLDEATSALDTATERDIQKALNNLVKGRSSLTIAHRLSTIANADIILVLKDGQIIERGSHRELLKMNGAFAQMWAEHIMAEGETYVPVPSTSAGTPIPGSKAPSVHAEGYLIGDKPGDAAAEAAAAGDVTEVTADKEEGVVPTAPADSGNTGEAAGEPADEPAKPTSYAAAAAAPPAADAPIAFPKASVEDVSVPAATSPTPIQTAAAIAFPSSGGDSTDGTRTPITGPQSVTFSPASTSRPGTPDQGKDKEPRRKRLSSQNIGRMVRRISMGARKASTSGSGDGAKSPIEEGKKKGKK
ncbi:P-loop containing nucleoside triphosphate hydrolase protein [Calocera viscosa TUFC12733]|uniref:p-loop containing nucleoside triphosphate hydrolase protein n=1 Tax=Calocera viscosa (strain TUFC12733) TaxID=1330018 RepID=A0A167IG85_CALVF|nr:P-loop containing nucleoside triphosphate hydrolase protein [Calocera viscosa TUFC12733]